MIEKDAKYWGSITPCVKLKEGLLISWNYRIGFTVQNLIYLTLPRYIRLISWLVCLPPFSPLLHLFKLVLRFLSSWFIDPKLFQSLCLVWFKLSHCIVAIVYLNACCDSHVRQIWCTDYLHAYDRIFKIGMIWCPYPHPLLTRIDYFLDEFYVLTCT